MRAGNFNGPVVYAHRRTRYDRSAHPLDDGHGGPEAPVLRFLPLSRGRRFPACRNITQQRVSDSQRPLSSRKVGVFAVAGSFDPCMLGWPLNEGLR